MKSTHTLHWDVDELSRALKIPQEDVLAYFRDGRRVSFVLERRIAQEILGGRIAENEGASFDVYDKNDKKWEVRSLTNSGIYFCPSYMIGSGREFEEKGFLEKLDEIEGYVVSDVERFPDVPVWKISRDDVKRWWEEGRLGVKTRIARETALDLIEDLQALRLF